MAISLGIYPIFRHTHVDKRHPTFQFWEVPVFFHSQIDGRMQWRTDQKIGPLYRWIKQLFAGFTSDPQRTSQKVAQASCLFVTAVEASDGTYGCVYMAATLASPQNNKNWLVVEPTPLKNMKVSWDDEIPNIWKNKIHVPEHQANLICCDCNLGNNCWLTARLQTTAVPLQKNSQKYAGMIFEDKPPSTSTSEKFLQRWCRGDLQKNLAILDTLQDQASSSFIMNPTNLALSRIWPSKRLLIYPNHPNSCLKVYYIVYNKIQTENGCLAEKSRFISLPLSQLFEKIGVARSNPLKVFLHIFWLIVQ